MDVGIHLPLRQWDRLPFSLGAAYLRDPTVAFWWLIKMWESLCYCGFWFSGLAFLVWVNNVTFPHYSRGISSLLGESCSGNFPFSALKAAIPQWVFNLLRRASSQVLFSVIIYLLWNALRSYWHATSIIIIYKYNMETLECRQLLRIWIRRSLL